MTSSSEILDITSLSDLQSLKNVTTTVTATSEDATTTTTIMTKVVLLFWAAWNEESTHGGPVDAVFVSLAASVRQSHHGHGGIRFGRVEAEAVPEISRMVSSAALLPFFRIPCLFLLLVGQCAFVLII